MKKLTLNYMVIGIVVLAMGIVVLAKGSAKAAIIFTETKLLALDDGLAGDNFGINISLSGDTALIGAPGVDDLGSRSGAAYVFVRDDGMWTEEEKLLASDGMAGDLFGGTVSLSGDIALIGVRGDDDPIAGTNNSGSAYVFVRDDGMWTQEAKLTASDAASGDAFGRGVSIDGDTALIGAPGGFFGSVTGSAYVFVRDDGMWTQVAKLLATDGMANDQFGRNVSVTASSAATALIGAPGGGFQTRFGLAYVFVGDDGMWTQEAKFTAGIDATVGDRFGFNVSIDGDTALIGAIEENDPVGSGSAYVFVRNDDDSSDDGIWTQEAKLLATDGMTGDLFGFGVSVRDDTALVGAILDSDAGFGTGSAYLFVRDDGMWTQEAKLTASDGAGFDLFGYSVSISDDTILIGAWLNDDKGTSSGSAYIFEDPEDDDSEDDDDSDS